PGGRTTNRPATSRSSSGSSKRRRVRRSASRRGIHVPARSAAASSSRNTNRPAKGNPSPQKAAELRLKVAEYRQYTLTHGASEQRSYMRWWWAKQDQLIQAQLAQNSR